MQASVKHHKHVGALFDGHLHVEVVHVGTCRQVVRRETRGNVALLVGCAQFCLDGPFQSVALSVAHGIGAGVVRCKVEIPYGHTRKLQYRAHHALHQFGVVQQVQRN